MLKSSAKPVNTRISLKVVMIGRIVLNMLNMTELCRIVVFMAVSIWCFVYTEYAPQLGRLAGGGCKAPELILNGSTVTARQNAYPDYGTLSEIKFTAQLPMPMSQHKNHLCKIKCMGGQWVGPLCQRAPAEVDEDNGRFHPVLRNCRLDLNGTKLLMIYENTTFREWHGWLPDRSKIVLRCDGAPGFYKFMGHDIVQCVDGDWDYEIPSCIPTTSITEYSEKSPPTILVRLPNGSSAVDFSRNQVVIYPGSNVHLECLFRRRDGEPEWSWSTGQQHRLTGWAIAADEREWIYRMSIFYIKKEDSGDYTCTTPKGMKNNVSIRIDAIRCKARDRSLSPANMLVKSEGNHIGQKIYYQCPKGFRMNGTNTSECFANGLWSSAVPSCEPIFCPPLDLTNTHLIMSELNTSYGGEAKFRCQRGYVMRGAKRIYCDWDGKWSNPIPTCVEVRCTPPSAPVNGRLIEETNPSRYNVGSIIQFACYEHHQLVGAETLICEENGVWSTSPPYCKAMCDYPGEPSNGRIVPLKFWYEPGDHLKVLCEPGYVTPISAFVICKSDGHWSIEIPHCTNYTEV